MILIKRLYTCAALAIAVCAAPAAAQTPVTPAAPASATSGGPVVNLGYAGFITGVESVHNTGHVFGGEAGARVWKHLDIIVEGGSFGDVVTQSQLDVATPLTNYLQQTQGQTASSTVKMPASYFGVGARWVFEDIALGGLARPYATFTVGGA